MKKAKEVSLWKRFTFILSLDYLMLSIFLQVPRVCKNKKVESVLISSRKMSIALAGVAQWIECWPENQSVAGSFPVRAHVWVVGQVPSWGAHERQPHIDVSLPLFLLPFPSLYK